MQIIYLIYDKKLYLIKSLCKLNCTIIFISQIYFIIGLTLCVLFYQVNNDPLDFNRCLYENIWNIDHMKQCGAGMYVNRVNTAQTSCFSAYTPFAEQKGLCDSCRIFWTVYKTILQCRVYIRTELARNAKNVAPAYFAIAWNASLPQRVRFAVSLQFACNVRWSIHPSP